MRCRQETWASRTVATVVTAVLVAAFLAGCANPDKAKAMNAIATEIRNTLAARPDVTKAEMGYQDNFEAPGAASVSIVAKPGVDLNSILDESIRLVWLSELNPLESLGVGVADPKDFSRGIAKDLTFDAAENAALQAKYGPRPK